MVVVQKDGTEQLRNNMINLGENWDVHNFCCVDIF